MRLLMIPARVALSSSSLPTTVGWDAGSTLPSPTGGSALLRRPPPRRAAPSRRVANVIDSWRYDGRWWEARELHRDYYLLELDGGAQLELFREGAEWWVARASD